MSYHLFTIVKRKSILIYHTKGLKFSHIGKLLHHHPPSISREWKQHTKSGSYSTNQAQASYHNAKAHYGRKRKFEINHHLINTIKHLFQDYQRSPEGIEGGYA